MVSPRWGKVPDSLPTSVTHAWLVTEPTPVKRCPLSHKTAYPGRRAGPALCCVLPGAWLWRVAWDRLITLRFAPVCCITLPAGGCIRNLFDRNLKAIMKGCFVVVFFKLEEKGNPFKIWKGESCLL